MAKGGFFYKLKPKGDRFDNEYRFFQLLSAAVDEPMRPFIPQFYGMAEIEGREYFKLAHVLNSFDAPTMHVMDVKMGIRCYTESELSNTAPRADLFERMLLMEPSVLSESERESASITKLRWMTLRDEMSSTRTLGFRIDGIRTGVESKTAFNSDLFRISSAEGTCEIFRSFLPRTASCSGCKPRDVAAGILSRLVSMREALHNSTLFAQNEFIGTTLLFVVDHLGRNGIWMIDFGVTLASEAPLKHDVPWTKGNHEDGFLIGMDNIITQWQMILKEEAWS